MYAAVAEEAAEMFNAQDPNEGWIVWILENNASLVVRIDKFIGQYVDGSNKVIWSCRCGWPITGGRPEITAGEILEEINFYKNLKKYSAEEQRAKLIEYYDAKQMEQMEAAYDACEEEEDNDDDE